MKHDAIRPVMAELGRDPEKPKGRPESPKVEQQRVMIRGRLGWPHSPAATIQRVAKAFNIHCTVLFR